MKKHVYILVLSFPIFAAAQNVGIGITAPLQKLHVDGGSFLITQPLTQTNSLPSAGQTITLTNGTSTQFQTTDSTGKIYDPGGSGGNYLANLLSNSNIPAATGCVGFEVAISTMGLGTGDSLIISEGPSWRNVLLAVGNNYSTTGTYIFNSPTLFLVFKSNTDASVGSGFTILFKRKYDNVAGQTAPTNAIAGNVFLYDPKNSRLQIGSYKESAYEAKNTLSIGTSIAHSDFSTAIGINNIVYGSNSFAIGQDNAVYDDIAYAMGYKNQVYGGYTTTTAIGYGLEAGGSSSPNKTQFVIGEYNENHSYSLFIVGNGSNNNFRRNAFEVDFDGNTYINGYYTFNSGFTQLGKSSEGAPLIKMKKITGYNMPAADNSWTFVPSGLTNMSKILSFQVIVTDGIYQYIPNNTYTGGQFRTNIDGTNIAVGTFNAASTLLYNKPIKILITYEE